MPCFAACRTGVNSATACPTGPCNNVQDLSFKCWLIFPQPRFRGGRGSDFLSGTFGIFGLIAVSPLISQCKLNDIIIIIIIIIYIYNAFINALSAHMVHINLNRIF